MFTVEIQEMRPSVFNGWQHGYKVLQYQITDGRRILCGSRTFDEKDDAERYRTALERKQHD